MAEDGNKAVSQRELLEELRQTAAFEARQAVESLRADLERKLQAEFDDRIDRYTQFVKNLTSGAQRVAAAALTVVAVTLAIFGIKTCADVKHAVADAAANAVAQRVRPDDPKSPFSREVDRLIGQAVAASHRIRMLRVAVEDSVSQPTLALTTGDADHLLRLMESPDTPLEVFGDAVVVLAATSRESNTEIWERIVSRFAVMITPRAMTVDPGSQRRRKVIEALASRADAAGMAPVLEQVHVLLGRDSERDLFLPTLDLIRRTGDVSALPALERLIERPIDPQVRKAVLHCLARLNVRHAKVRDELERLKSDASVKAIERLKILAAVLDGVARGGAEQDTEERLKVAAGLVQAATRATPVLGLSRLGPSKIGQVSVTLMSRVEGVRLMVPGPIVELREEPFRLSVERVLRDLNSAGDLRMLASFVDSVASDGDAVLRPTQVVGDVPAGVALKIADTTVSGPTRLILSSRPGGQGAELWALWRNQEGQLRQGRVERWLGGTPTIRWHVDPTQFVRME